MSIRPGDCQHPLFSDDDLLENEALIAKTWGDAPPLKCPNCREYLYPHGEGDEMTVYVGEPFGAGEDPAGRPSPSTHPEYWTE